jgi:mannopine transport system substrate-binding protein
MIKLGETVKRRDLLRLSAGSFALAATGGVFSRPAAADTLNALIQQARNAGQDRVVMAGGTGAYVDLVKKYFYEPFTTMTGIKVDVIGGSYGERIAKLKAMAAAGTMEWDAIAMSIDSLTPQAEPLLVDLGSCATLDDVVAKGVSGACVKHGVLFDIGGGILTYDTRAFPGGKPQPQGWTDFWNVKAFPGPRALPNMGSPWWVLIAALIADGVPTDKLFPLDVDRALKKMDEIKDNIAVWWRSGDQSQQIFRNREVVMAMMFSGRASRLQAEGLPVNVDWNGAIVDASVWAVTKNAPRPHAALALLDFIYTRPDAHATFIGESFNATAQREAIDLLPQDKRASVVTAQANWSKVVHIDRGWLAQNQEAVLKRWTAWLAG